MIITIKHKNLALLFIMFSTIVSLLGDMIFKSFGFYNDRPEFYLKYIKTFCFLILLIWLLFNSVDYFKSTIHIRKNNLPFINFLSYICIIMILPMVLYLLIMYNELLSSGANLDEVRSKLQNSIPLLPRFFWYSSLILTYLLHKDNKLEQQSIRLKLVKITIITLLIFYGSKSLLLFPFIASTINKSFSISFKKIFFIVVGVFILVLFSTVYNNIRSSNKFFLNEKEKIAIDVFASFFPEQRDGAYLMEINPSESRFNYNYFQENTYFFLRGITHKKIVDFLTKEDTHIYQKKKIYNLQSDLGFEVGGALNPRIGLIGFSYVFYGQTGMIINLLIFSAGLVLIALLGKYFFHQKYQSLLNYLFIIWLWTFNSNFLINLDFFFYQLYFGIYIIIFYHVLKSVSNYGKTKNSIFRKSSIQISH